MGMIQTLSLYELVGVIIWSLAIGFIVGYLAATFSAVRMVRRKLNK